MIRTKMRSIRNWSLYLLCLMIVGACAKVVDVNLPAGEKGDKGPNGMNSYELWKQAVLEGKIKGANKDNVEFVDYVKYVQGAGGVAGESAYDMWVRLVKAGEVDNPYSVTDPKSKWPATEIEVTDFWKFLSGGAIYIDKETGNWVIGSRNTGVKAQGNQGAPGAPATPPTVEIKNGNWWVNGVDMGVRAEARDGQNGQNGETPTLEVSDKGKWIINGVETEHDAKGKDAAPFVVTIDEKTRHWKVGTQDLGPAFGEPGTKGTDGKDGKSAYELWKDYISTGNVDNPAKPGQKWDKNKNSMTDFWHFLTKKDPTPAETPAP